MTPSPSAKPMDDQILNTPDSSAQVPDSRACAEIPPHPYASLPPPDILDNSGLAPVPSEAECHALWDKYGMLPNIRRHSGLVASIARALAERASQLGIAVNVAEVLAAGLLHDLAKTYCLKYGGAHAELGAAWAVQETGNRRIGQAVLLHVHWPWPLPKDAGVCRTPLLIQYADKRVMHDRCVTVRERFEDLLVRYGRTPQARAGIRCSWAQTVTLERTLAQQLDWKIDENAFDCGRLVP